MVQLHEGHYLIADIIYPLPTWVNWLVYQPEGSVVGCERRPRLEQHGCGVEWHVQGQQLNIGRVVLDEDNGRLEAVTGDSLLDDKGLRFRPKVIRSLHIKLTAGSSAVSLEPNGEIREWFSAKPEVTPSGWQKLEGGGYVVRGLHAAHDENDVRLHIC